MNAKVVKMLNEQINMELFSAYLYMDFSNWFFEKNMMGFAHWFRVQAQEERDHALLIYDFLHHAGEPVVLQSLAKPETPYSTIVEVLKAALAHEKLITKSIYAIYAAAMKAEEFGAKVLLDWFVKEQMEEEANVNDLIAKAELFGSDPKSLYILNQELSARVYAPPSLVIGE